MLKKKLYKRPKVKKITLKSGERVLGACKDIGTAGPNPGGVCNKPDFCVAISAG